MLIHTWKCICCLSGISALVLFSISTKLLLRLGDQEIFSLKFSSYSMIKRETEVNTSTFKAINEYSLRYKRKLYLFMTILILPVQDFFSS